MFITTAASTILSNGEVRFANTVKLLTVNIPFLVAIGTMMEILCRHGVQPFVTSAADPDTHRQLPYHEKGYAWDFRSRDLTDPMVVYGEIVTAFSALDKRWRVLYHNQGTGFHYHVEYQFDK